MFSNQPKYRPLSGVRVLSLCLNLPGPAALMRCKRMGARCVKLEPPASAAAVQAGTTNSSSDPMALYSPAAFAELHEGVRRVQANLKTEAGLKTLHRELEKAHVLLTSFRPSALQKLGLSWKTLHARYPSLSQVAIVGAAGARAEEPGHDLTYLAEHDLIAGVELPLSLYADMAGSLLATEAVLQAALQRQHQILRTGDALSVRGLYREVDLAGAAQYLALPRRWGLTQANGDVGGAHAGYQVYPCRDGRVALAALEPHFAMALCRAANIPHDPSLGSIVDRMRLPSTREAIARWLQQKTCAQLQQLAAAQDLPLHTLGNT